MRSGTRAARVVAMGVATALATVSIGSLGAPRSAPAGPPPAASSAAPAAPAAPAPPTDDAAELRRRGNDAMAAFRPGEALDAYKQAYEKTHDPALLYNMARALEALEDYPAALDRYEDFARLAPPDLRARVPKLDELLVSLRARVARLSVTCNVPGARVLFRDRTVGQTVGGGDKLVVSLAAGRGVLEVEADGYNAFQRTLQLPGGQLVAVDVQLVPREVAGMLIVSSEPGGGTVFVDGRELGTAPVEESVGAGTHKVDVRLPGYLETSTSVVVSVGERRVVTVRLGQGTPITQKWWFWTGLGTLVAAGVAITYAVTTERSPDKGTIAPYQIRVTP